MPNHDAKVYIKHQDTKQFLNLDVTLDQPEIGRRLKRMWPEDLIR
jgi:hypothetical protein